MEDDELSPSQKFSGKKYLLAIGITEYAETANNSKFKKLDYPVANAQHLVEVLVEKYEFQDLSQFVLLDEKAKKDDIADAISDLINNLLKPDDQLLVFYAGHGTKLKNGEGYWVPFDAHDLPDKNLSVAATLASLRGCCAQILLITDCCFSGTATERVSKETLFASPDTTSEFFALASCAQFEETPDDSLFFKALIEILEHKEIDFFSTLFDSLQHQLSDTIEQAAPSKQKWQFILQKSDKVKPVLKEACWDFNFESQAGKMRQTVPRKLNLVYLNGTENCGHSIFIRRFIGHVRTKIPLQDVIPQILKLSDNEAVAPAKIWNSFGGNLSIAPSSGLPNSAEQTLRAILQNEQRGNHRIFFLKIGSRFGAEHDETLQKSTLNFWEELNSMPLAADMTARFFFVILDERGTNRILDKEPFVTTNTSQDCSFYYFPVIENMDSIKLEAWKLTKEPDFQPLKFQPFVDLPIGEFAGDDFFVANTIIKICEKCNYGNLADEILFQKK